MPQDFGFKIVTLDEGAGPVKAVRDASGRIVTAEQLDAIRERQETELAQVTDLRDRLAAGDAAAVGQATGQVRDGLERQVVMLEKQKADAAAALAKLQANDTAAVADVVRRTLEQLTRRVEMLAASRDRSAAMLAELAPDPTISSSPEPAVVTSAP